MVKINIFEKGRIKIENNQCEILLNEKDYNEFIDSVKCDLEGLFMPEKDVINFFKDSGITIKKEVIKPVSLDELKGYVIADVLEGKTPFKNEKFIVLWLLNPKTETIIEYMIKTDLNSPLLRGIRKGVDGMSKKKVFISQPMQGKSNNKIREERDGIVKILESEGYKVLDSIVAETPEDAFNEPVYYLSKSIYRLSLADYVYFMDGWEKARGCKIEHSIAKAYGIPILHYDPTHQVPLWEGD